jgi:hypothetical protein
MSRGDMIDRSHQCCGAYLQVNLHRISFFGLLFHRRGHERRLSSRLVRGCTFHSFDLFQQVVLGRRRLRVQIHGRTSCTQRGWLRMGFFVPAERIEEFDLNVERVVHR